ncbi:hypothetical protein C8R44DRAFT_850068 [Mycena epipterygia]|nr:hypothetical protein C8R44DRAFT_850068 [Mycena epipterygia]
MKLKGKMLTKAMLSFLFLDSKPLEPSRNTPTSLSSRATALKGIIHLSYNSGFLLSILECRLKLSEEAIKRDVPSANIRRLALDLSSLAAVRTAAAELNAYSEPLHVLIHNAAAALVAFKLTADGLENQLATAHVGPFLLTKLLTPKLLAARTADYTPRVVFVSSAAHAAAAGVDLLLRALEHPEAATSQAFDTYAQAKSANVITAIELSKRSEGKINAYSLHPGVIYTNANQKEESIPVLQELGVLGQDGLPSSEKYEWKTMAQGAATTVVAAFDPRLNDKPGAYLVDCVEANGQIAPHSSDPVSGAKLWAVTEKIIGETFVF